MNDLQNIIMSDNSRLFAAIYDFPRSNDKSTTVNETLGIELAKPRRRRPNWYSFKFKNENFTIMHSTGDMLMFANNRHCPETILEDLVEYFRA